MIYFEPDYIEFFKELDQNNNKEWFDVNRKRYEKSVKEPFKRFITDLIEVMKRDLPRLDMEAKHAIMRINRDIRFSKDKSPYKNQIGAVISEYGRKDHARPGLFFQASHQNVRIYSGSFGLEKDELKKVRDHILYNTDDFDAAVNDKNFVKYYNGILGKKNKRIPEDYKELEESHPLIFNKTFYYYSDLEEKVLFEDGLIEKVLERYAMTNPINRFITEALLED